MSRYSLLSGIAVATCVLAVSTMASAQAVKDFDIPAGSLRSALTAFAVQSDQQILFTSALVSGQRSEGITGQFEPGEALNRLLAGTGLTWTQSRPGVFALVRTRVTEESSLPDAVEDVVVTGSLLKTSGELASPVLVLNRDALDRRGLGTVAETLADLPQNYAGSGTAIAALTLSDSAGSNASLGTGINLRGLGPSATLVLVNGRRLAGTGFRGEFADVSALPSAAVERVDVLLDGASALYGVNNTILDNCAVYTAFSALDPLTQEKVSRLTGTVSESRKSRSSPAGLGTGRSTVSRSEIERPLMEPGEIRALPDETQLVFVAGRRPLRTDKLLYDRRRPFRDRADRQPPEQSLRVDGPPIASHPWAGRLGLGEDPEAGLPLFKEVAAAMDDKKAVARVAEAYTRVAQEMAAEKAALDHLQGLNDA